MKPRRRGIDRRHVLVGVGIISFLGMLVAMVFSPTFEPVQSFRGDGYSRGALGHRAFIQTMGGMGHRVRTSRYMSGSSAGEANVLFVLAPHQSKVDRGEYSGFITPEHLGRRVGETVLVLPKYTAQYPDVDRPQWVGKIEITSLETAGHYLKGIRDAPRLARGDPVHGCQWSDGRPAKLALKTVQFMEPAASISPILVCGDQIIAGHGFTLSGGAVLLVADPDLISNWSFGKLDNAPIAYELVNGFIGGRDIVVDETSHGHLVPPSIWRMMLEFPMVILTAQGLLLILLVAWVSVVRFGVPDRADDTIRPGVSYLITNTAALLAFGGYSASALNEYLDFSIRDVARHLRLSAVCSRPELVATLDQLGEQRGLARSLSEVITGMEKTGSRSRTVAAHRRVRLARRIHDWKKEILNHAG
jgi:hypothetical protein